MRAFEAVDGDEGWEGDEVHNATRKSCKTTTATSNAMYTPLIRELVVEE